MRGFLCAGLVGAVVAVAALLPTGSSPARAPAVAACEQTVDVLIYTVNKRSALLGALENNPNPCAQYYVDIPPCPGDRTQLRGQGCNRARPAAVEVHSHGPNFHALAEFKWGAWAGVRGSWTSRALEFRRRMVAAHYDVASGDAWAINELRKATRKTSAARANAREAILGLREGGGEPDVKGAVFIPGFGQTTPKQSTYKGLLRNWTLDAAFWRTMAPSVRWWGQETYPDCFGTCVAKSRLAARAAALGAFLEHPVRLAAGGPARAATARSFFHRSYMALAGAYWKGRGYGRTHVIDLRTMQRLIRLQVFVARGWGPPGGRYSSRRIGFAWNETAGIKPAQAQALAGTLAVALKAAYGPGGNAAKVCFTAAACAPATAKARLATQWNAFTW